MGNILPQLVRLKTGTTTLEINLAEIQKIGNSSTRRPTYIALAHIIKRCSTISQGHILYCGHSSLIHNSQKLQPTCPSPEEWIQKMWFIAQWNITQVLKTRSSCILREIDGTKKKYLKYSNPQPKGHTLYVFTEKWILANKYIIPMIHPTDPTKLN